MDNNNSNIQPSILPDSQETQYGLLAKRSRIGGRQENQDSLGYSETKHGLLIVVCDGMGGVKGGKTASELAVRNIIEQVNTTQFTDADEILTNAIKAANQVVYQASRAIPELSGMGTTVTALLINERKATAAHVGDSRIYQIRGTQKVFRTFDHSMVFELVKRKSITEEQARLSAESNVILRALGTKPDIEVEINGNLGYLKGDRFLLCSDGVCGALEEKELIKLIKGDKSVDTTIENIASTIDKIGKDSGGRHDNLTAILIEVNKNSKLKTKMDTKSKTIIGIVISLLIISLAGNVQQRNSKSKTEKTVVTSSDSIVGELKDSISILIQKTLSKDSLSKIEQNRQEETIKKMRSKRQADSIMIINIEKDLKVSKAREVIKESKPSSTIKQGTKTNK
jgi:serine/threonine protein phosphatase PrpC